MKGMLLAAGLGTRLRPVTDYYAKPAVPFLNIPLLYYPVVLMEAAGARELVINTHYKPEQIEFLAEEIPGFNGTVHISPEIEKPLGSGGAIWAAKKWFAGTGDFLVANADEVIIPSTPTKISEFKYQHENSGALATIFVMRHPGVGTQFGGVWTDDSGRVHAFGKQKPDSNKNLVGFHYIGLLLLSDRVFKYLPDGESNLLYDSLMNGMKAGEKVEIFEDKCSWFETGNPQDFLEACEKIMHAKEGSLEREFIRSMGQRFWRNKRSSVSAIETSDPCLVGANVQFSAKVQVKGFGVIGDQAEIGANCVIEESIIMPRARLADGTHVRRQIILPDQY